MGLVVNMFSTAQMELLLMKESMGMGSEYRKGKGLMEVRWNARRWSGE